MTGAGAAARGHGGLRSPPGNRFAALLWLLVMLACLCYCGQRVVQGQAFYSNVMELLPRDERQVALNELTELMVDRFQDRLLVLVRAYDEPDDLVRVGALRQALADSPHLDMSLELVPDQQDLIDLYRPYSQQLLTQASRRWLREHSAQELAEQRYRQFYQPVAQPRPYPLAEDPFNLGGYWLGQLMPAVDFDQRGGQPLLIDRAAPEEQAWFVVVATLLNSPFNLALQHDVAERLGQFRRQFPDAQLLTSGMVFHAAAGTVQAKREISTVGLGSLVGIVLLVVVVFRSLRPLFVVLICLAGGAVMALTVSLLVFGQIHIITLVFGSTLLGVAVDYVFHFLVCAHREGSGERARRLLRYAMAVGVMSSVTAFLLQISGPFPGLRQMAVFSAVGLVGAWLTVLALAPWYRPVPVRLDAWTSRLFSTWVVPLGRRRERIRLLPGLLVLLLAAVSVLSLQRGGANDQVANLNSSPAALLASEARIQQLLRQPSSSRFFLVGAETEELLLRKLEALNAVAEESGARVSSLRSLAQYVPSVATQLANRDLVEETLYAQDGALALLSRRLGMTVGSASVNSGSISEAKDTGLLLLPAALSASKVAQLAPPLLDSTTDDGRAQWQTVVLITAEFDPGLADAVADAIDGVSFVDQTAQLSQLLGRYRQSMTRVLLGTLVLLGFVLGLRYRRRSLRIMLPLCLSLLVAVAVAAQQGVTVFHLMALLLVLGIGIDTSVFYLEVGLTSQSWLAASLSSMTSILAFGLLSLSAVPVLHQFGIIVFFGILSCWLLTPLFHTPQSIVLKGPHHG